MQSRDGRGRFVPRDAWVVRGRWVKHIDPALPDYSQPDTFRPTLSELLNVPRRVWRHYRNQRGAA